mgnify:CR=1 FL=1
MRCCMRSFTSDFSCLCMNFFIHNALQSSRQDLVTRFVYNGPMVRFSSQYGLFLASKSSLGGIEIFTWLLFVLDGHVLGSVTMPLIFVVISSHHLDFWPSCPMEWFVWLGRMGSYECTPSAPLGQIVRQISLFILSPIS